MESLLRSSESAVPSEITESVTYAKISSSYLLGQAASVQQMIQDICRQMVDEYTTRRKSTERMPGTTSLSRASLALEQARKNLHDEFRLFEDDSLAWARFLREGNMRDYADGGRPTVFLREALEIAQAVNGAKATVMKVCGRMSLGGRSI